jgi:hypothetical protein
MNLAEKLEMIQNKRQDKNWNPKQTTARPQSKSHPVMGRALELRHLEITVQDWTLISADQEGYSGIISDTLASHARDEDKHDQQLLWLAEYWGCVGTSAKAFYLIENWQQLDVDPMVKKMCLEAGVFFPILAMMAKYASQDLYTQAIRQWIMSDESAHVAVARLLVSESRLKIPQPLVDLVEDTIRFIVGDYDTDYWLKMSYNALRSGAIPQSESVSTVAEPDPFTQRSRKHIAYQIL